jgi:hypothetical protein
MLDIRSLEMARFATMKSMVLIELDKICLENVAKPSPPTKDEVQLCIWGTNLHALEGKQPFSPILAFWDMNSPSKPSNWDRGRTS